MSQSEAGRSATGVKNPTPSAPVKGMNVVVHRGPQRYIVVDGERFDVSYHGPGWGWSVHLPDFGSLVADGYWTLTELREKAADDVRTWKSHQ